MSKRPPKSAPRPAAPDQTSGATKPGTRALRPEEQALWEAVAKSVDRAFGPRSAGPDRAAPPPNPEQAAAQRRARQAKSALSGSAADPQRLKPLGPDEPATRFRPAGGPVEPLGPKTPGLDRRTARRLSRGETPPQARLDLHGLTAERAHGALIGFIRSQHAMGARCVLVITGKGGRGDDALSEWRAAGSGVLRTMAPEWLRQPPLGALVTGVYQAHRRHGGDGALYVYLRKKR